MNPQGVAVHSFKVPSAEELNQDYLWRYAQRLPARGEIGIFNRSDYEEVLVVRVHPENLDRQKLASGSKKGDVWHRRYREINDWERYLTDNGFRIVKLFLNLSREEQRVRLLGRIDLPDHNWKFSAADLKERALWDEYQKVFSEMLSHTGTQWAPWYVIPRRSKVVRADRSRCRARSRGDGDRPAVPACEQATARGAARGQGGLRGSGTEGRRRGPVRA